MRLGSLGLRNGELRNVAEQVVPQLKRHGELRSVAALVMAS